MAMTGSDAALPYQEPSIATILNLTGFLVALNLLNTCLDQLLYCGLIGQLFIGVLWGTPGAKWLNRDIETVIQQLGYLGLIMLVYEGGLSTSFKSMKANIGLSLCVAITGIATPMGLSFILKELVSASSLQAFAAGAALSATSLGTTFTILSTTNLVTTRLGTVITIAAMLDDVVGLVMVQIIANMGGSASFSATTVIRPIFVSIGFVVGLFALCILLIQPILKKVLTAREKLPRFLTTMQFAFLSQTCVLVGTVAGATYAGTSSLFAAYLAGVIVTWVDEIIAESKVPSGSTGVTLSPGSHMRDHQHTDASGSVGDNRENSDDQSVSSASPTASPTMQQDSLQDSVPTGENVYVKYYRQPVNRILIPLFFASIGFAIPIKEMFEGNVVWRGIIYALLMSFGKMVTGLWLVRFSLRPFSDLRPALRKWFPCANFLLCGAYKLRSQKNQRKEKAPEQNSHPSKKATKGPNKNTSGEVPRQRPESSSAGSRSQVEPQGHTPNGTPDSNNTPALSSKPKSLYPPSILGLAMVARGEVGYLIASLAQSQGMFPSRPSGKTSEVYLVIIWAISICTLLGPISVGTLVKRVQKLQKMRAPSGADPLGIWGI
ncbi:uncharacterized protein N7459_005202 [Penicillium hispanicum]|uniref:uncharacterized protein n=1 Tax=Penicillium hispanicum TaxID=1080232 RepID=UPI0025421C99|nr:uncharacterized protein N7459_005202 [Penicillium hispanicum]KAJ5585402.1 hypothetical protein N7459_005202 [Penicillium hispanicum]